MSKYNEFDYARLMFAPYGLHQFLKEREGVFVARFGVKPSYSGIVEVVMKAKPNANLSSKQLLQKIATIYNKVAAGEWKKNVKVGSAPHVKLLEIIQVFALNEETKMEGLKEHIENLEGGFFKELITTATESYYVDVRNYTGMMQIGELIKALDSKVTDQHKELKKILEEKGKEEQSLKESIQAIANELRAELNKFDDSPLRRKMLKFVRNLELGGGGIEYGS